jgi:phenylalanyl-tRNA synthetase beta chain
VLAARDYLEVINYAFVDARWEADFCDNAAPVVLANPIASQMGVMRSSLIGGLVANVATNRARRIDRVRVFEVGRCFLKSDAKDPVPGFRQPLRIGVLAAGSAAAEQWGLASRAVDFYDLKADLDALLAPVAARYEPARHAAFHPGRCARVLVEGAPIGYLGELHPQWIQRYELGSAPVAFELDLEPLLMRTLPAYQEVSRFPPVVRDLALVVSQSVSAGALLEGLSDNAPGIVQDIRLFDLYTGKGVPQGQKSLAFRVVMQDTEKTLADAEVDAALAALVQAAEREFGARLRG